MDQRAAGYRAGGHTHAHDRDSRRHLWSSSAPLQLPATLDRRLEDKDRQTRSAQHGRGRDVLFGRDDRRGRDDRHERHPSAPHASHAYRDEPRKDRPEEQRLPGLGAADGQRGRPQLKAPDHSRRVYSCGTDSIHSRGKGYAGSQDRCVHRNDACGTFAGVFDGHGHHGDKVAEYAKESVVREVFARAGKQPLGQQQDAIASAFEATHKQLSENKQFALYSGSTACTAFFPEGAKEVIVANCGDSRAVLARKDSRGGKLMAVELSRDHTPSCPREKRRIQALQGRISRSLVPVRQARGEVGLVPMGPERVWDSGGTCGLGVSRSLGDLHMAPFVSAKAEITSNKLSDDDRMVILGSDGVWNHISNQQAVDIASKHSCPTKAAQAISQAARSRWAAETGGQLWDDITTVVVNLPNVSQQRPGTGDSRPGGCREREKPPERLPVPDRRVRTYGR